MRRLFLLALLVPGAFAASRSMSFLDVLHLRTVSQGRLSPDGKRFAYVLASLDWKTGKRLKDLYLTDIETGGGRQLTFTPAHNETDPAFSPGGGWLAFLSDRDGRNQLYLLPIAGGEARKVSNAEGGVDSFAFSRDGNWLAYRAGRAESRRLYLYEIGAGKTRELGRPGAPVGRWAWAPDSSRLYFTAPESVDPFDRKRLEAKFDIRIADFPRAPEQLWSISLDGREEKRLTSTSGVSVRGFNISDDGRWIGLTTQPDGRYADSRASEACLLDVATGKIEQLTDNRVSESTPVVSPDGEWVAFAAPEGFTDFRRERVYVRPARGGALRMLPAGWDGDVRSFFWSSDSRQLIFDEGVGLNAHLFGIDAGSGAVRQLTDSTGAVSGTYADGPDRFVLLYENASQPEDYYLSAPSDLGRRDHWRRLTNANPQVAEFALGAYESLRWKSTDGREIEGLLIKPVGYEPGRRYPLIVQVHGGPAGASVNRFSSSYGSYVHVFAAGGYAVFQPNYRGSSNYGEQFRMEIAGDYFRQGFDDIMTGVDELIRRGIADPDRLGMMGWSAGGHWSNWTLTHTDRFKAISTGAGAANWISLYAQTDTQSTREFYLRGTPYDNWDHDLDVSPLRYIKNARTPTLIHAGENDPRVPRPQSEELYMALKTLGVPAELIVYPRMGHALNEPRYQYVKMYAEYIWFEKWIRGRDTWLTWKDLVDSLPVENAKSDEILPGQNRSGDVLPRGPATRPKDRLGRGEKPAGAARHPADAPGRPGVHLPQRRGVGGSGAGASRFRAAAGSERP